MSSPTKAGILAAYGRNAGQLIDRYTSADADKLLAPVLSYLPDPPARVLEVGAGPGRDTKWFADQGYDVTAVEPVAPFRDAGQARTGSKATWIDDSLPDLSRLGDQNFDLIYIMAVWQHVPPGADTVALHRLRALAAPGATVIISLRFGPGHPDRPVFAIDHAATLDRARIAGFEVLADFDAPGLAKESHVDWDVTWRWLVLRA